MAQDVFSKMAEDPWLLNEDGYLNADTDIKEIIYHPTLNVILICTSSGVVRVLDVNSGVVLQSSYLSAINQAEVTCRYIPGKDRILFSDGQAIGVRSDYNGVLLLDSILQKPISDPKDEIKLELPLSEAIILKQSLTSANVPGVEHVINELTDVISNAQKQAKKGIKAQKWNTVCVQLPLDILRTAAVSSVSELLVKNQHTPELGVASAVQERLSDLTGEQSNASDRRSMASEAKRRETFSHWPHMDYKWALPDQMAQAGFYHQPNSSGDDRAMCFTCTVCLVCWEWTDEPWSEHERHSPNCPFVRGEYTQNVPLSVTYATNPAIDATYRGVNVKIFGTSTVSNLLATANEEGLISVFDISGKIKRTHSFFVTQFDSFILEKYTQDFGVPGSWSDIDDVKYPTDNQITALSIVSEKSDDSSCRPTIVCGLNIRCRTIQKYKSPIIESFNDLNKNDLASNIMDTNEASSAFGNSCLYLVVYDFLYNKEQENSENETKSEITTIVDNSKNNPTNDENEKNNYFSPQVMEHLSSIYKTLIPGESDEVFLPPPIPVIKQQQQQQHSGPRVLPIDMQITETDSSQSEPFCTNQDCSYINMNGQLNCIITETLEKTISDHITELKNSKTSKKLNYSRAVQCIPLPFQYKNREDLCISDILTTQDGHHLLVVLKSLFEKEKSVLLVYALDFSCKMVKLLDDEPVMVRELADFEKPIEVRLLPNIEKLDDFPDITKKGICGNLVMVCVDGAVRILELVTMKMICLAQLENEKFVSAAYCNSLERLCASTEHGSLHFYALNDTDNESSEDHDDDDLFGFNTDTPNINSSQVPDSIDGPETAKCFHEPPEIISIIDLIRLHALTQFEPLKNGYCAVVPPCWSEIQQTQRQRRYHPQTLKNDCDQYTKTWRLQTDTTTWDEHIFEITLPTTPVSLGHVDVSFTLQPSAALPHVEVTLLRQNTSGIGHKRDVKFAVDETVMIDMLQCADNPVISQEYLRAHNADILSGPVNIASTLDLSEKNGVVTLTSPKLLKSRNRTLLLHISAVYPKEEVNKKNAIGKRASGGLVEKLGHKNEFYMGCDCIHELSVTIYSAKHTEIVHERTHRNFMLESNVFVQSLILTVNNNFTNEVLNLSLDILNWIASIRLTRNRSNNGEAPNQQLELLSIIENNLSGLLQQCLLLGERSIAHKCMKLIITCCNGAKNINDSIKTNFESSILNALLTILDSIHEIRSAGGLQWFFSLLLNVTSKYDASLVASKCLSLLNGMSHELHNRVNPYHLLLRSRYGLYGTPLELELFDIEPPPFAKGSTTYVTYASAVSGEVSIPAADSFENYSFHKESGINPKDVLSNSETKLKWKDLAPPKIIRGLIETEPLHFTCISASEGTKLERADVTNNIIINEMPFSINPFHGTTSNKKEDIHIIKQFINEFAEANKSSSTPQPGSSHPTKWQVYLDGIAGQKPPVTVEVIDSFYQNMKSLENYVENTTTTTTTTTTSSKPSNQQHHHHHHQQEDLFVTNQGNLPWQHLLVAPPQQVIVVERMHSGARRFITLDFGQPILLTDILIPSCDDLVSLSIDIWLKNEEVNATRLVVATDIGARNLFLNDLQPPPSCRYMKITTIGRYGMTTARCRIPVGFFYGHILVLPEEITPEFGQQSTNFTCNDLEKQLTLLSKLFEDINCRYSLACSKLKELLRPFLVADMKNASHLATYMNIMKDRGPNNSNPEHTKIFSAYQESITYQRQLNTVRNVMARLEKSLNKQPHNQKVQKDILNTSSDKLRSIAEGLLEVLLTIDTEVDIDPMNCQKLFRGLCVSQSARLQLLSAVFLDKSCRSKNYWGNFLADTLAEMFATSNTEKFPQDRVFILLAYLSRKSPERSAVIDAALRVILDTLRPLQDNRNSLLAVSVDLPMLSWLLMYLSLQLDTCRNSIQSVTRWDWVFGEIVGKVSAENSKVNNRKRINKRMNKQQIDNLDAAQKLVQTSAQALSALSNHAASLNSKLDAALKAQQFLMKKVKYKLKDPKTSSSSTDNSIMTKKSKETPEPICEKMIVKKLPVHVNTAHCLAVAKALLELVLSMDHSSSADMLLLSFKVMARLVNLAKIKLGQLLNQEQLLNLVNFCLASKIPWAPHALACLLQDIIEQGYTGQTVTNEDHDMEIDNSASTSWATNDLISDVENFSNFIVAEQFIPEPVAVPLKPNSSNNYLLPSVNESDDSDLEDILDVDSIDKEVTFKKPVKTSSFCCSTNSSAIDLRLDMSVETPAEISLRKLITKNTQSLLQSVNATSPTNESEEPLSAWPIQVASIHPESLDTNNKMLVQCFDVLFEKIQLLPTSSVEQILQLWLTLNCNTKNDGFDPSIAPTVILRGDAVKSLLSTVAWAPRLSLITWCFALQTLTIVCNTTHSESDLSLHWADLTRMAGIIINHPDFVQILLRMLSGSGLTFADKALAGPSLCKALHDYIIRLQMRADIVSPVSKLGGQLKTLLLKTVHQLVQPSGPITTRQGPLDAQCKLLKAMLYLDFCNADIGVALSIFESAGPLIYNYVANVDKIKCINIGEKHNVVSTTFNEIFACVLGSDPIKIDLQVSLDVLFLTLLKLLAKLIKAPCRNDQSEAMDVEPLGTSQTDECKAEQINQRSSSPEPSLADLVLQHHPSIIKFLQSLAACKSSSLCMLANVSQKAAFANLTDPTNVGDAIFHVLALLAKNASKKELMLQPLLIFLSQAPQLSEPMIWFILQVLDTEDSIREFVNSGGIGVLGRSFVTSSSTPNTISRVGTISTVMQHFSGLNPTSDANTAIASASASRKLQQATIENKLSLVNFAPCCTIKCQSGTAQPADILIQGTAAPHKRARTPQWSYHFYPEEAHTELTLQLPSAILLREVHLQPHLSSLATCPSAVALEVSANGPSRLVPVCPPLPTSGMVFIRLHLPVPEIVNTVLIRLYRPRDANNIGLSQIRLLGNLAFGGNLSQQSETSEDESHCRHSLGWLRLLHHCFTVPSEGELVKQIISAASDVPRLLSTCCGLLLVPSHVLPIYLPCLEKVMRELSLQNLENGIGAIKILLNSRSSIIEPLNFADNAWQDRLLINATGYQSACELLYQICEHQDEDTPYRVMMILEWLQNVAQHAIDTNSTNNCNPAYISSIASILWSSNQANINYDLKSMITAEFFKLIYNLKTKIDNNIALKYSLDSLLCSLCYIKPELFPMLLQRIGVLVPNLSTDHGASISDDRKDSESMTDDNKQSFELDSEWYGHLVVGELTKLNLSNEQLETVALVSRSPTAIQQLLDSGLPKILNSAIFEFCTSTEDNNLVPMAKLENVTAILKFFTDLSDEKTMRDWLGSSDGSSFWLYLLHWLCKKPFMKKTNLQSEAHAQLEEVCVRFLSKCCLCHPVNQARLAKVLCEVIALQSNGISGFMRRLVLQLLLENEKIPVSIKADETLYKNVKLTQAYIPAHPAFKQTYNRALLYLSTNTTLADILEQHIYFNTSYKMETSNNSKKPNLSKRDMFKGWFTEDSDLSMAAGVTAKDKRAKDAKNQITATPQLKKKRYMASETSTVNDVIGGRLIKCESFSDQPLPLNLNLGQLLRLIELKGATADWPCVHLTVCQSKGDDKNNCDINPNLYQQPPFSSALQVFSAMGGLALLAQHLPTVYPEAIRPPPTEKTTIEPSDSDWIKVEDCDDIYEDIEETAGTSSPSKSSGLVPNVPPHSLTAFGLFLRLPGYAEVLLKDMKKALCLLRLVLGVTDDGEGGDIFQSPVADSLPTLPFEVLKKLYDATPLSTDDGRLLRRISINTGVVHLLLGCLGIFTHQTQINNEKDGQKDSRNKEDRSQLYWAKGTGFGTGSTQQSWNVEQALLKQRSEEEHVTVLLQVLASYINPNGAAADELTENVLPSTFLELLINSSLLPALSSYLRNDSVLDMARHIPLYKAALQLLRAFAASSQLIELLLPQKSRANEPSISSLLKNMKTCVDTYTSKLRINTKTSSKLKMKLREQLEELEQGEGLATLMPDIQDTAILVATVTSGQFDSDQENDGNISLERLTFASLEEKYLKIMKGLQFGSHEMITELPEGGLKFVISHHFESNAKSTSEQSHPARVKRIAQEAVTLSTSLPLSYSSSVFVRYDTSRLDVMKVLITGPADTPYANGCFELDVFFPPDYPLSPMMINLETTGHHAVRFNPNLYNDGKVCLSVLNTWHGRPEEKWNAQTSSFLQVLVSIQSLILVPEPYFNEPGYERSRGTPAGTLSSKEYNANICQATVRWAMLEQILNPCPCFKDVIQTHFYLKRNEILAQIENWIKDLECDVLEKRTSRTANKRSPTTNLDNFKKVFHQLKEQLVKLKSPDGVDDDEPKTPTNNIEATSNLENSVNQNDVDNDIDMEKMVKEMCEFDAT